MYRDVSSRTVNRSMAPFQQRAPRLNLSFPVTFHTGGSALRGHCLNLSESGLLAVFAEPLELWTTGELELVFEEQRALQPARVARTQDRESGMAFVFSGEAQRAFVRAMLQFAAERTHLVGAPPF